MICIINVSNISFKSKLNWLLDSAYRDSQERLVYRFVSPYSTLC